MGAFHRRSLTLWLLLLLLACNVDRQPDGTFRVGCLGDSNTKDGWQTGTDVRWCSLMSGVLPTVPAASNGTFTSIPTAWENHAQLGAGTTEYPTGTGLPIQLQQLSPGVDAVIAAFGTNDAYPFFGLTPQQAIDNLKATDTVTRAYGIQLWVATAPPSHFPAPLQAWQQEFNTLVQSTFCRWIDFTTGFDTLLETDGLHVTAAGQALRTERVRTALSTRDCP